jgi:hypothetical protein
VRGTEPQPAEAAGLRFFKSRRLNPAAAEAFGEGGFSLIFAFVCDIRIFNG